MVLTPASAADVAQLREFLRDADLTLAGLDDESVRLWVDRDADGTVVGSTGYECSRDGRVRGSAQKSPTEERQDDEWRARRADHQRARSRS